MTYNVIDIFDRLINVCNFRNLKEISVHYGYKENWASNTRSRNTIPWDLCLKVAIEYKLSLDYLIFGEGDESIKIDTNEVKTSITEGIFSAVQCDMIELKKDVKISTIANLITSELIENSNKGEEKDTKKAI
jgi:hypothetical protein